MAKSHVSELLKKLDRQIRANKILSELNNYVNLKDSLTTVIKHCKEITDCEAIGIRLSNGKDYPYYAFEGFPPAYIVKENHLCSLNPKQKIFKFEDNRVWSTTCLCSDVVNGRIEKDLPCFTSQGSFWTNDLPQLVGIGDQNCLYTGYKSLALIRILAGEQCIGLIQLFSNRTKFTLDLILYLEMIGTYIGAAVSNSMVYTQMKDAMESLKRLIPICSHCKRVSCTEEEWQTIEDYLYEHMGIEFTHTICPECMESLYPEIFSKIKREHKTG